MQKNRELNIAFMTFSAKAGAGISVFKSLLPAIAKVDKSNKYYVFISEDQEEIKRVIPSEFQVISFKKIPKNPYLRVMWEQVVMPFVLKKYNIDLLYSVGNTTVLFAPCKIILFIENPNPFTMVSQNWTISEKIRNKLLFLLTYFSSRRANKIRFCSYRSKEIISKKLRIPENKTFVLYHGLNDIWYGDDINVSPLPFSYILSVSVVAPHKNFEVLIKAFSLLKKENYYNGKLVIVGDTCYQFYYEKLKKLIDSLNLKNDVIFAGKVPNEEIKRFYQNADLFVFPSLEETFGIPLIEALVSGTPTIASDGNRYKELFIPFNELGKNYIVYFDPYSENDLLEKMKDLLNRRDLISANLKQVKEGLIEQYHINKIAEILVFEFNKLGDN
ncbi:glycosyltransferase family 4 protein [Thermodesulfovibrio hydrogeniphilus]